MSRTRLRLGALVCALAVVAVVPASAAAKPTITMSGSTSVAPLATLLAKRWVRVCHGCVRFKILQGGSDVGVADVGAGRVTIGNSSRDPKPSDPGGLRFTKIAGDAICLVTNRANRVAQLDQNGVQAIFSGGVRNWSGVPGATVDGTIDLTVRTAASGTQDAFQKIFMGSKKIFSGASQKSSNGLVQAAVQRDANAVGYVSLAFTRGTNTVAYKGVPCTLRNAKSGQYGGLRNFYMVTRGAPRGATRRFIGWVTHNRLAARVAATQWVPLR